ncbi:hypothetical protein HK100_011257 [Physocladia obscura]|uniref:Xaa-Pro dipeptidase n=1 Tax=Physocladia obscura TaxID=109957 RepID=A0AAD5XE96_9FUNG|nr:hypothetical protein HK100_011257 [Physocladia obscura]
MVFPAPDIDYGALHAECRGRLFAELNAADALKNKDVVHVALFQGGAASFRHDTDHEHLFRQESHFHYLFGINEPGLFALIDLRTRETHVFVPRLGLDYEVWCGRVPSNSEYAAKYAVEYVHYVDELPAVASRLLLANGTEKAQLHILSGVNSDSKRAIVPVDVVAALGDTLATNARIAVNTAVLYDALVEARAIKTELELALLRHVNTLSSLAHIDVMKRTRIGMIEYQLESLFLAYTSFEGGSRYAAYTCICGTGSNAAVLHYGHAAAPNSKQLSAGDMCLLDMGAELHCYTSDITVSFPADGVFSTRQRAVYGGVLAALTAVRGAIRAGVEWVDMHLLAERAIVQALIDAGIVLLAGATLERVVDLEVGALFFPHGLGHLMGKDVHDCGGYPHGRARLDRKGLSSLRMNRTLKKGMVLTNEPGCYFIPALLLPAFDNPVLAPHLNKDLIVNEYLNFGGVRLEEDLIVTETGCENMTKVPREIDEIERVMASGRSYQPESEIQ